MLLVHGVAFSSDVWTALAEQLGQRDGSARLVSVDLRGHGYSTAASTGPEDIWRDLPLVSQQLGLHRPVLVGHDTGGYFVAAAAASYPEAFSAVLSVDGSMALPTEAAREWLASVTSPELASGFIARFGLAATGPDQESLQRFRTDLIGDVTEDWLTGETGRSNATTGLTRSVLVREDGSWVRQPTVGELLTVASIPDDSPAFPDMHLYERIEVPLWFIQAHEGIHLDEQPVLETLTADRDDRRLIHLMGGHHLQQTHPDQVAEVLVRLLDSLDAH